MANSIRIVEFQTGGQITEVAVLESSLGFEVSGTALIRDTLSILRGERNQQMIKRGGRYDGESFGGERLSNNTFKFTVLLGAGTTDALLQKIGDFLLVTERVPGTLYIEFKPDDATYPSYLEIRAPAKVQTNESWREQRLAGVMRVDVEWPVAPLACGAPMDITDSDVASHLADYTFDSSSAAGFPVDGSGDALNVERRLIHTGRGYLMGDHQVTVLAGGLSMLPYDGYKVGAVLGRVASDSYIECYVDQSSGDGRLRIDIVIGGTRTNRANVALGGPLGAGSFHVVGRKTDNSITAELWSGAPTPVGTPDASTNYTLSGGESVTFGPGKLGAAGASFVPTRSDKQLFSLEILPLTYRMIKVPGLINLGTKAPGTAPALGSVAITIPSAPSLPFAMVGWLGSWSPGALVAADSGLWATSGLTDNADASCLSGRVRETSGMVGTEYAEIAFSSADLLADDESPGSSSIEVWARVKVGSTLPSTARIRVSIKNPFVERWSVEYGSAGKPLTAPSSGTAYRFIKLGTIRDIPQKTIPLVGGTTLRVSTSGGTGTGAFGIDYITCVHPSRRAMRPTGKTAVSVGNFFSGGVDMQRVIASDLSGAVGRGYPTFYAAELPSPANGLVGAPILIPHDKFLRLFCKLSSMVPDDPTISASSEAVSYNASIHLGITPRYHYLRDD